MSAAEPEKIGRFRTRRQRIGIAVLLLGGAMLLVGGLMLGLTIVPGTAQATTSTVYALPVEASVPLRAGAWVVFEQTGSTAHKGVVTISENRSPRLTAAQIVITAPDGSSVSAHQPSGSQTIDRNGEIYTGVAVFDASMSGTFTVQISGDAGGRVVIAPSLESMFATAGPWFATVLLSVPMLGLGLVLAFVARTPAQAASPVFRRSGTWAQPPGTVRHAAPEPPPGWYPDRSQPGRMVWWDGRQWHPPTQDSSPGPRQGA